MAGTYCADKHINKIISNLVSNGWGFQRGGKHNKIYSPSGRMVVISRTPSDSRRAALQMMCDIRHAQAG